MYKNAVVVPINGFVLRSGGCVYSEAIVARVTPFCLVSLQGDMIWSTTVDVQDFQVVRQATSSELLCVTRRLNAAKEIKELNDQVAKRKMMGPNKPAILCKDPIF